ncbi:MAG TPA: response regulator [Chloroflexota bacterium]|nr:response regulator [Chloroflexota bacterium]
MPDEVAGGRRILIVDDARLTRLTLRKTLERMGYEVTEAVNGQDGLEKYKELKPDCVLMDISMPEMDGLTALKEIRAFDPQARVAMVTSLRERAVVTEAMTAGAADFIVKPYREPRLRAALHLLLGPS